jgi:hypothetical protein
MATFAIHSRQELAATSLPIRPANRGFRVAHFANGYDLAFVVVAVRVRQLLD